ncbi:MAG: type II secretion system F family protein [Thermodesulfobacteriota bacterium]
MPRFAYQAINENGTTVSGVLEADTQELANTLLSARGLIPARITLEGRATSWLARLDQMLTAIRPWDIILFTKQLSTMLKAGIPIVRLFQILESQTDNKKLKAIINDLIQDIQAGSSLTEAFRKHPVAFSPLYVSMLQAGEASGQLPEVLERLIYIIEHEYKVKKDIQSALAYPIIVVVALVAAFFILLTYVVPKFVSIFARAKVALPWPTKVCIVMYTAIFDYWPILLGLVVVLGTGLYLYLKSENGRLVKDAALIRLPLLGPLFIKSAMSRFASIFAILQASGVAILDIMKILTGTIGNYAISRSFDALADKLKEGRGISEPLRSAEYFPPMVVNMVAIGEESGNLDEMLSAVSKHYDTEVEYATAKLSMAIGPLLVVGLAVVVGFFALAIYLPMWDLTKTVSPR